VSRTSSTLPLFINASSARTIDASAPVKGIDIIK